MPKTKKLYIVPRGQGDLLDQFIEQAEVAKQERDKLRRRVARLHKLVRQDDGLSVPPDEYWRVRAELAEALLAESLSRRNGRAHDEFDDKVTS